MHDSQNAQDQAGFSVDNAVPRVPAMVLADMTKRNSGILSVFTSFNANKKHSDLSVVHGKDDRLVKSDSENEAPPSERVVYLTFDDGPSGQTDKILKTLDKYGIKATWFVCGNTGNTEKIADIWAAGHQVGIHSDTHELNGIYSSPGAFFADLEKAGKKIERQIGEVPTLIRFPGGSHSGYSEKSLSGILDGIRARGWHYFDWNVTIGDSTIPMASVEELMNNIRETSADCKSCCVLMHDFDAKSSTADALDQVIEYFIDQGYKFDYLTADSFGYHF